MRGVAAHAHPGGVVELIDQDLIIIAPDRVDMRDLVDRFPDMAARYDVLIDRRWRERRSAEPASAGAERRRQDRRRLDVSERLRTNGWVVIPAAQRHS